MKKELLGADTTLTIPFHDVDSAQIAWHGHYAKYLEIARGTLLDKFSYNYMEMAESGYFWPVIDMHIRYIAPLSYMQKIRIRASLIEWENRLLIHYKISDPDSGQRLTRASTTQVAVKIDSGEMQLASPPVLAKRLAQAGIT